MLHVPSCTDRQAHEGYSILKKWRDMYFDVYSVDQRRKGGPPAGVPPACLYSAGRDGLDRQVSLAEAVRV